MDTVIITLRQPNKDVDLELPVAVPLFMLGPILAEALSENDPPVSMSDNSSITVRIVTAKTIVRPAETLAQAGVVDGDVLELTTTHHTPPPDPPFPQEKGAYLQCQETGQIFLCQGRAMLIGRLPHHPIRLHALPHNEVVSRTHANLLRRNDGYWLKDERSANGTIVDGYMLDPGERVRLRPNSLIQFGVAGPVLIFHQRD